MFLPSISSADVDAIKKLSRSERDALKERINSADPHNIFQSAGDSRNPDVRKIICPKCGNGEGEDSTPVEAMHTNSGIWLYYCQKCGEFSGDLLKIIADEERLNLRDGEDFCKALAIGARFIGYVTGTPLKQKSAQHVERKNDDDAERAAQLPLIKADIAEAQAHLEDLPESQRRGISVETYRHFDCGYLEKWVHPKTRIGKKKVKPSRRVIFPAGEHYQAVALPADRTPKNKKYWKLSAGELQLFNSVALRDADTILVAEGQYDAISIWQAFGGGVAVVAVLGAANWRKTLLPLLDDCAGKRFLILFDVDKSNSGEKGAAALLGELAKRRIPAVCRFFDDFLSDADKKKIGNKTIDANVILEKLGNEVLKTVTEKIISDAQREFEATEGKTSDGNQAGGNENNAPMNATFEEIRRQCKWSRDKYGNPTKIKSDVFNYELVFERDKNLRGLFGKDEFRQETVFLKRAPWHNKNLPLKDTWDDSDDAELRLYLAKHYEEMGTTQRTLDFVIRIARENSFHAIRNFFENLPKWDGQPRAETIFVKFLGAADTRYTREVTKHFLFGAIARALYPGCDFQSVVILQGRQGIGKSRILRMLGGKHGVNPKGDSWHIALRDQLDDSHAVDAMRKGWIVEIEEFAAASRADVNSMKGVLSADDVTRRFAYERHAKTVRAHWIFAATCNDDAPLRDQTGARRFLPIKCHNQESTIVDGMTPEFIQQVWAEAYLAFKEMFPTANDFDADKLRLTPDIQAQAAAEAQSVTQDDGLATEIKSFLERKIPPLIIWHLLSKEERRKFFVDGGTFKIELADLQARFKNASGKRFDEIKPTFEAACEVKDGYVRQFTDKGDRWYCVFYGAEQRNHICAAEIFNECFGQDNRKRMPRINETLARLDGWHAGERLRNADPAYSDQKNPYYQD